MNYTDFLKLLSNRLALHQSETRRLVRAFRSIIKNLILSNQNITITSLGSFKAHTEHPEKEYSHYHGYDITVRIKKALVFTPDVETEKLWFFIPGHTDRGAADISTLVARKAGVSNKLARRFVKETGKTIAISLKKSDKLYICGLGLFKTAPSHESSADVKPVFKAGASLRRIINRSLTRTQNPVAQLAGSAAAKKLELNSSQNLTSDSLKASMLTLKKTISSLSETHEHSASLSETQTPAPIVTYETPGPEAMPVGHGGGSAGGGSHIKRTIGNQKTDHQPDNKLPSLTQDAINEPIHDYDLYNKYLHSGEEAILRQNDKQPWLEWFIIALFLSTLAIGIYLIKPTTTPDKDINPPSLAFSKTAAAPIDALKSEKPEPEITLKKISPTWLISKGDTLWGISKTHYGNPHLWASIYKANSGILTSPDHLKIGIQLSLPDITNNQIHKPEMSTTSHEVVSPGHGPLWNVASGESLWAIAERHYGNPFLWPLIFHNNIDKIKSPDVIETGTSLVLPHTTSDIRSFSKKERNALKESYQTAYISYKRAGNPNAEAYLTFSQNL